MNSPDGWNVHRLKQVERLETSEAFSTWGREVEIRSDFMGFRWRGEVYGCSLIIYIPLRMAPNIEEEEDEEYCKLGFYSRLRYRLRTDPRRVADLGMVFSSVLVEWIGATLMAPITPW